MTIRRKVITLKGPGASLQPVSRRDAGRGYQKRYDLARFLEASSFRGGRGNGVGFIC
jgi:hypothetical protein